MMRAFSTLAALLLFLGCVQPSETMPDVIEPPVNGLKEREPDSCGAGDLSGMLGQTEGMLRTVRLKNPYRVIALGEVVTQDYSASRLNFYLDDKGMIMRIACG